jgi:uncharacterized protein DUF1259
VRIEGEPRFAGRPALVRGEGPQAINFQPTGAGKAAITGDFVLTRDKVNPLIKELRSNGIESHARRIVPAALSSFLGPMTTS